jgi:1,4-dihydroxy-2-naphthoate octaprenyltransferase
VRHNLINFSDGYVSEVLFTSSYPLNFVCPFLYIVHSISIIFYVKCIAVLLILRRVSADKNDDQEQERIQQLAKFQQTALLHALSC